MYDACRGNQEILNLCVCVIVCVCVCVICVCVCVYVCVCVCVFLNCFLIRYKCIVLTDHEKNVALIFGASIELKANLKKCATLLSLDLIIVYNIDRNDSVGSIQVLTNVAYSRLVFT